MEFRPILNALKYHKTGTILVALQIAVSLAIIVNAMFIVNQRVEKMNRPTGMDTDNIIAISVRGIDSSYDAGENIRRDLDMLNNISGVVAASRISHVPLSGSGSATGIRTVPDRDVTPVITARYQVNELGIKTLGINIASGRNFYPEEIPFWKPGEEEPPTMSIILITQALADELFPEGDALGNTVYFNDLDPVTIIGIIDQMQGSWVGWEGLEKNVLYPGSPASRNVTYLVRTEPGERDRIMSVVEQELARLNDNRVIRYVRSHEEIIDRSYRFDKVMAGVLVSVVVLLIMLTALVIVGLASYFVTQRTRQIGTRRALGATRFDIIRYFLIENWIITTGGIITGCILTIIVSYWLETSFDLPRLEPGYLIGAIILFWVLSQFAAYFPAKRASNIPPAIATRTV